MTRINNFFQNLVAGVEREEGQGTVEYILITGLIAVAVVVLAIAGIVPAVTTVIGETAGSITGA